eukprot:ctg_2203.g332
MWPTSSLLSGNPVVVGVFGSLAFENGRRPKRSQSASRARSCSVATPALPSPPLHHARIRTYDRAHQIERLAGAARLVRPHRDDRGVRAPVAKTAGTTYAPERVGGAGAR